jgi:hypothetical protein
MSKMFTAPHRRLGPIFQTALIRAYKVLGLVALAAILIGLVSFLTVNLFYLMNRSWVRPVILSPTHGAVLNAMSTLSNETSRRDDLINERDQLKAELGGIERVLQVNQEFQSQFEGTQVDPAQMRGAAAYEALIARRAYSESIIERERSAARKEVIGRQIERLDSAIKRYDALISQIQSSAYIHSMDRHVTVAFVPYENLDNVEEGMSIYACRWGLVWCRDVGTIGAQLKGEVTDTHPQTGNSLRGVMIEMRLDDREAAEERALFVGKRPFWIL